MGAWGIDPIDEKREADAGAIWELLERLHDTAAKGQLVAYLACFTESAVFMGTNASERWAMGDFREKCKQIFRPGRG